MKSLRFISLDISLGSYNSFVDNIISLSNYKYGTYVCVANVHMLMEAYWNRKFGRLVNNATIVTPDGMPIAKGIKLLYGTEQPRICGMDILPDLLKKAEMEQIKVAIVGGTNEQHEHFKQYTQEHLPKLELQGMYSQHFDNISQEEETSIIDDINHSGAKLILVSLGCPKQELWMSRMQGKINACLVGIGGALPVLIGLQKRAPIWMQKYSLEWLYRLIKEPKRLFKRYLRTNIPFLFLLFFHAITKQETRQGYFDISQG